MLLRAYSIFGTWLLALSVASPALAAGKGKNKASDSAEAAKEGDEKTADEKADSDKDAKSSKRDKKKKKKGKKDDAEAEEKKAEDDKAADADKSTEGGSDALGGSAGSAEQADMPDPNVWEKPPEDQEKPKQVEVAAPVVPERGDNRPWMVGIAAGWGLKLDRATGGLGADPYTLGAGVRGGYTFDFKLYVGVWFMWYLGQTTSGSTARTAVGVKETHANYWQFGVDVGYDWWIADVIIRPSIELGEAIAVTDATGRTTSIADFMLGPGLSVIYPWDNLFLAGEMRANVVTGDCVAALLLAAQFGMRFEE
jgi:hypothetical protein